MKKHKLNITRPDFLLELMGGDPDALTTSSMKRCLAKTTPLCYCVYTALMEGDLDLNDVLSMDNDGESIGIKMKSKSLAKDLRDRCREREVRYGSHYYMVKLKVRDQFLFCSLDEKETFTDG